MLLFLGLNTYRVGKQIQLSQVQPFFLSLSHTFGYFYFIEINSAVSMDDWIEITHFNLGAL